MTFCVTFASSVFSTATMGVAELYGVSEEAAALRMSSFVLGFGVSPLIFSLISLAFIVPIWLLLVLSDETNPA